MKLPKIDEALFSPVNNPNTFNLSMSLVAPNEVLSPEFAFDGMYESLSLQMTRLDSSGGSLSVALIETRITREQDVFVPYVNLDSTPAVVMDFPFRMLTERSSKLISPGDSLLAVIDCRSGYSIRLKLLSLVEDMELNITGSVG